MHIKNNKAILLSLDARGPDDKDRMNFRLERGEVDASIAEAKADLDEARAEAAADPGQGTARVDAFEKRFNNLVALGEQIDAAGGSYAYMPQAFADTFGELSAPARELAVMVAMSADKVDGGLTVDDVRKAMVADIGPGASAGTSGSASDFRRALYADVTQAIEKAAATAAAPPSADPVLAAGGPLATRMQNLTAPSEPTPSADAKALREAISAAVPSAAAMAGGDAGTLASLINERIAEARGSGERLVRVWPDDLDELLRGPLKQAGTLSTDKLVEAYEAIGAELDKLGFVEVEGASDIGVWFKLPEADANPSSPDDFAAGLTAKLPAPPAGESGDVVGLIKATLESAAAAGETSIDLEPDVLDGPLKAAFPSPAKGYDAVAEALKQLGYAAMADGFVGVSASWERDDAKAPTITDLVAAVAEQVSAPSSAPADALTALVTDKLSAARAAGETSIDLEPEQLDALLKPVFGAPYKGYEAVADALKDAGYQAMSDGFIGVSASWDD